jgi:thioredoxin reductase (NADPH)
MTEGSSPHPGVFTRLTPDQRDRVRQWGRSRSFEEGEVLFEQGERDVGFFLVEEGELRMVQRDPTGDRVVVEPGPGDFVGDLGIVTRQGTPGAAVARTGCRVTHLDGQELREMIQADAELGEVILGTFLQRRAHLQAGGHHQVTLVGPGWDPATTELRDFLSRNRVLFRWLDPEQDPETEAVLERTGVAPPDLPALVTHDRVLRRPSRQEVAGALGIRGEPGREIYDLVIVGAGPAGLAAAVYGASEGLSTLVLEATAPGGQAGTTSRIENYLGFPGGISGAELTDRAVTQAQKFGAEIRSPCRAAGLSCEGGGARVEIEAGGVVRGRTVLVATGATYRRLPAVVESDFSGHGVYHAATASEAELCEGEDVVVVGGGNSAGQAAMFLAGRAARVRIAVRGDSLADSMSRYLLDRIRRSGSIEVLRETEVEELHGEGRLEAVTVSGPGGRRRIGAAGLYVMIGADPNTGWLEGALELDPDGFVRTGRDAIPGEEGWPPARAPFSLETSEPGVFAAGDVRAGAANRVAGAVGEGAMVVRYVHAALGG